MAKKSAPSESVYKLVEVFGTSTKSWEDAAQQIRGALTAKTLRDLRIAEVVKMDMKVEDGKVSEYRTRVLHLLQSTRPEWSKVCACVTAKATSLSTPPSLTLRRPSYRTTRCESIAV